MRGTCISTTGVSSCLRKMGLATSNFAFGTFGTAMSRPSKRGLMKLIPVASVAGAEWQLCWRPRAIGGPAGQETSLLPADAVAGSSTWWSASNRPPMAQGPLAASSGNTLRRSAIPFTWGQADLAPAGRRHMSAGAGGSASESEASSPGAGDEAASSLGLAAADTVQFGVADSDMVIEVASSTMWSRFYSGSPDFWVNIHYAQEVFSPLPSASTPQYMQHCLGVTTLVLDTECSSPAPCLCPRRNGSTVVGVDHGGDARNACAHLPRVCLPAKGRRETYASPHPSSSSSASDTHTQTSPEHAHFLEDVEDAQAITRVCHFSRRSPHAWPPHASRNRGSSAARG